MPSSPDEIVPSGPLFKFLSLADGQTVPWQDRLDQLLAGKAYHPSPSQFNDPFDCLPSIKVPKSIDELRQKQHLMVPRFAAAMPHLSEAFIADSLDQAFKHATIDQITDVIAQTLQNTSHQMGVFSLAANIKNVLMWSHYASNHTGIAVRFDWRKQLRGGLMPLLKVRYEERRSTILGYFDDGFPDEGVAHAMRTKAEFWRYEQEWRSLVPGGARTIVDFDPTVVDGVVLGANCTVEHEAWIRDRVQDRDLPIYRARPDPDTFDLHFMAREEDVARWGQPMRGFPLT